MSKVRSVREDELAMWVHSLAPWDVFLNVTFRRPVSEEVGGMKIRRVLRAHATGASWVYFMERNPNGDGGHHAHGVMYGLRIQRRDLWRYLFAECGRTLLEPPRSKGDVLSYCAKYVTKDAVWWDVNVNPGTRESLARAVVRDVDEVASAAVPPEPLSA